MLEKLSLRSKIMILSICGILVTALTTIILTLVNVSQQEDMIKGKLFLASEDLSNSIQDQFFERYGNAKTFAHFFKNILGYSRESVNTLNQFSAIYGIYDLILICDLNGKLLFVNDKDPSGKKINSEILYGMNFSKATWFKETLEKKFLEDPKKDFTNVNFQDADFDELVEKVYNEKKFTTIFSTFIYNSKGEPIAIISNHANFVWLENTVTRIYESFAKSGLKSLELNLLDNEGNIILDFNPSTNDYKSNVIHDDKILNKYNLVKGGQIAAINLTKGIEGVVESRNLRRNTPQFTAHKLVVGNKIVDKISWKLLVRIDRDEALVTIGRTQILFFVILLAILIISISASLYFSSGLSNVIMILANKLAEGNKRLNKTSGELNQDSQELSAASLQQTSSLQETASAVNEISSMMNKASEIAETSKRKSDENRNKINAGKKAIETMVHSISNIKASNINVLKEVIEGNKRISEIVKVIAEIENKTKIIDEIVFQTKILSFNASVEAARAGEHGRGFSIVAEEVGNLAQMSGSSSKEISEMLDNSVGKVKKIIDETKENVERIMVTSQEAIQRGEYISQECMEIFEKIYVNSEEVNTLIYEISNSSREQARGISEINNAMNELDNLTHQNSNIAQKSAETSSELYKESHELEAMTMSLLQLVHGYKIKFTVKKFKDNDSNKYSGHTKKEFNNTSALKNKNYEKNKLDYKNQKSTNKINVGENKTSKKDEVPAYNDERFEEL
ncbi:methyl-accepting chemotaxis protein [Fluviispira multicolorata]|uniref:Methyl-accepting transducer domain-containing protein n=1 Tax=Fluviispira multicolorata TaxID=2654512 RepID=A0A833JEM9_9BACT|nr:methyl-accepting chemotaxis protein [Fluviispira multicolorata]KAB8029929.1 hypothetical protein GCL57_10360 [Fluviispira multicolorata]